MIAVAIIVGAVAMIWLAESGPESEPDPAGARSASAVPSVEEIRPLASANATVREERPTTATAPPSMHIPEARQVSLSSTDRRRGETEEQYQARVYWLEKFSQFERRAQLTERQRELVLQALADLQVQAVLSRQSLMEAIRSPGEDVVLPSLADMDRALGEDLLARLREFLSSEQVLAFRRKAALNSYYAYSLSKPLDIGGSEGAK